MSTPLDLLKTPSRAERESSFSERLQFVNVAAKVLELGENRLPLGGRGWKQNKRINRTMPQLATPKREIVAQFAREEKDTGSPEVQVAILTERIKHLTEHLKDLKKDHSARRGLLKMVGRRSRLLKYLKRTNHETYLKTINTLGIRR